jgi:hypothetical protein
MAKEQTKEELPKVNGMISNGTADLKGEAKAKARVKKNKKKVVDGKKTK